MARTLKIGTARRAALQTMVDGGLLYVEIEGVDGTTYDPGDHPGWLLYDGPPKRLSASVVNWLQGHWTEWCPRNRAEVFCEATRGKARALLAGRDVLYLGTAARLMIAAAAIAASIALASPALAHGCGEHAGHTHVHKCQ